VEDVRRPVPAVLAGAVFAAFALMPLIAGDYWIGQATRYVLFGIFAMSLSLVWGRAGLLCFGQAMFFGVGGYVMAVLTTGALGAAAVVQPWLALPLAVAAATAFAAVLGAFLFRGGGISGAYLAIVTLAIAVILEQAVRSSYPLGADNGLVGVPALPLGADPWNPVPGYYLVLATAAAIYVGLDRLLASPAGVVLEAVRTDPGRLAFLGYRVAVIRVAVFALGGAIAALAGAVYVATDAFASPRLIGFGLSAEVLIWVALGGRHVLLAAFLAATAVRLAEGFLSGALGDWWLLALGGAFMVSVIVLPRGLVATPLLWLAARIPGGRGR
jgi:urea transport system permease protein